MLLLGLQATTSDTAPWTKKGIFIGKVNKYTPPPSYL